MVGVWVHDPKTQCIKLCKYRIWSRVLQPQVAANAVARRCFSAGERFAAEDLRADALQQDAPQEPCALQRLGAGGVARLLDLEAELDPGVSEPIPHRIGGAQQLGPLLLRRQGL